MDVAAGYSRPHPFAHTIDPDLFYRNPGHESACAELIAAAGTYAGFLVLSGEPGTGKTVVLRRVTRALEQAGIRVLRFSDVGPVLELLHPLDGETGSLEAATPTAEGEAFLADLRARLRSVEATVVALDEAQRLESSEFGLLRTLVVAERAAGRGLAVLLVGQHGFDVKLGGLDRDPVDRIFALRIGLSPLETSDVRGYMAYRLEHAGLRLDDVFEADAVDRIAAYTKGIPGMINHLCDVALHTASKACIPRVSASTVDAAAGWVRLQLPRPPGATAEVERLRRHRPRVALRACVRHAGAWMAPAAAVERAARVWVLQRAVSAGAMLTASARRAGAAMAATAAAVERAVLWSLHRAVSAGTMLTASARRVGAALAATAAAVERAARVWVLQGAVSAGAMLTASARRVGAALAATTTAAERAVLWSLHRAASAGAMLTASARCVGAALAAAAVAAERAVLWSLHRAVSAGATLTASARCVGAAMAAAWCVARRRVGAWSAAGAASMRAKLWRWSPAFGVIALILTIIALGFALWPTSDAPPTGLSSGVSLPATSDDFIERPPPSDTPKPSDTPQPVRPWDTGRKSSVRAGTLGETPRRSTPETLGPGARGPRSFSADRTPSDH